MNSKVRTLLSQLFIKIFSKAEFINDEQYNLILYRLRTGENANIRSPKSFNEHILANKVFDDEYGLATFTDKYAVREYVAKEIGEQYLVRNFGVWDSVDDINFEMLPQSFVIKATHGSGWNVLVKNKSDINRNRICTKLKRVLHKNYYYMSREKNYRNIQPRVVCEEYLTPVDSRGLIDFKVFCFHGVSKFYSISYEKSGFSYYNLFYADGHKIDIKSKYNDIEENGIRDMACNILPLAEQLAKKFKFVRVDFYIVDGNIYFSELTFHSGGGIRPIEPKEVDFKLGEFFD